MKATLKNITLLYNNESESNIKALCPILYIECSITTHCSIQHIENNIKLTLHNGESNIIAELHI